MLDPKTLKLYKRLLQYILPFKALITGTLLAIVTIAVMEPMTAWVLKNLVDESLIAKDPDSFVVIPMMLAGVFILKGFAEYFSKVFSQWIAQKAILSIRADMYQKMFQLPYSVFQNYGTGALLSKITYDVPQASSALSNAWVTLIRDSLTVLALVAYLLYISWSLTLILLIIGPVVAWIIDKASKLMRQSSKAMQQNMGQLTHRLEESLTAHQDIKMFGAEQYEQDRFQLTATELLNNTMKVTKVSAFNVPLVQILAAVALAIVVYIALKMSADNAFTTGELLSYITAMALVFEPVRRLTSINETVQKGMAAAESIFELLDQPNETNTGTLKPTKIKGEICFKDSYFQYPNSKTPQFNNFNLKIKAGKTTALVGQSGSGKSTLVSLITRFYETSSGSINIDDIDLHTLERHHLRQQVSLVSQKVTLFNDTIAANIAYGQPNVDIEKIISAAKAAYAWEFIEKLPDGIHTNIGENGGLLSGGQRQRIAIARAFLKNAPILILDEATSALDNESEIKIQQALEKLQKDKTVIVIAHRLSTIKNADNIVVLNKGAILEEGTHEELMKHNGNYHKLYQSGFKNEDN
jgi:subfamily B ATP-binding cassette protein MsbA